MKNWGFIYLLFTFIVLIILSVLNLFSNNYGIKTFLFLFVSLVGIISIRCYYEKKYYIISLTLLRLISFFQVFMVTFEGFNYKFLAGTDFTFYLFYISGITFQLKFKIFNASVQFNDFAESGEFMFGINIIHLLLFLFLLKLPSRLIVSYSNEISLP
jgi:hypothetical protein